MASPQYTGSNTFQIILCHIDSTIVFQYKSMSGITNGNDITIGIESVGRIYRFWNTLRIFTNHQIIVSCFYHLHYQMQLQLQMLLQIGMTMKKNKGLFLSGQGDDYVMISNV